MRDICTVLCTPGLCLGVVLHGSGASSALEHASCGPCRHDPVPQVLMSYPYSAAAKNPVCALPIPPVVSRFLDADAEAAGGAQHSQRAAINRKRVSEAFLLWYARRFMQAECPLLLETFNLNLPLDDLLQQVGVVVMVRRGGALVRYGDGTYFISFNKQCDLCTTFGMRVCGKVTRWVKK